MSVSSTLTTVAQNADRPNAARPGRMLRRSAVAVPEEVLERQIQQVGGPTSSPPERNQLPRAAWPGCGTNAPMMP